MRFLADESCDFAVVRAPRAAGHEVMAVAELARGAVDDEVLALARKDAQVLLTEDKDFGQLVFGEAHASSGVILIRFPAGARRQLGDTVVRAVYTLGERVAGSFVVIEPGRIRIGSHAHPSPEV